MWNNDWREELEQTNYDCYIRLCECRNTRSDIVTMAKLVYKYNSETFSKEDCLWRILEWVGDWNGQCEVADLTVGQFKNALSRI